MGRGNSLTDHEKGMIDAFEKDGHSQREIAKKINRSRCAVNNYIKYEFLKEKSGSIQISAFFRGGLIFLYQSVCPYVVGKVYIYAR